ncbi:MAG: glycoside hydrolase family 3 N-terminal domain-containing protein [Candidatus Promineifilaceae bacterium]
MREALIDQKLMLAFKGTEPPDRILTLLEERAIGGFSLFRPSNVKSPAQVRVLTTTLQSAAAQAGHPRLLIATDQEGGQLVSMGEGTIQFPGNMALGATRDPDLAHLVGRAIGMELAALGININYAPVCDLNTNPDNPNVGVRAFGDDPELVSQLAVAMITGMQEAGVAATAKHFPGNGESAIDPHYGVPVLSHNEKRLDEYELVPFQRAIEANVKVMMTAHVAIPALTGRADLPATLSPKIMTGLLREKMGYEGLLISDALDMGAITQGLGQVIDVIAAVRAGIDLLLLMHDEEAEERVTAGLQLAAARGLLGDIRIKDSINRILSLKDWIGGFRQPGFNVVGCADHLELERTVAHRSITLIRNEMRLLPLKLPAEARIAVVTPKSEDLTPADTSSYIRPALADSIREYHPNVDEFIVSQKPSASELSALNVDSAEFDLIIAGTTSASMQPQQGVMVDQLIATGVPVVTVAMRTPYDLMAYPRTNTHICTYGIQPSTMVALAAALFGKIPFRGKLPVTIPGFFELGHGLDL